MVNSKSQVYRLTRRLIVNGVRCDLTDLSSNPGTSEDVAWCLKSVAARIAAEASCGLDSHTAKRVQWLPVAVEVNVNSLPLCCGKVLLDDAYQTYPDIHACHSYTINVEDSLHSRITNWMENASLTERPASGQADEVLAPQSNFEQTDVHEESAWHSSSEHNDVEHEAPQHLASDQGDEEEESSSQQSASAQGGDEASSQSDSDPGPGPPMNAQKLHNFTEAVVNSTPDIPRCGRRLEDSVTVQDMIECLRTAIPQVLAERIRYIQNCAASPEFDEEFPSNEYINDRIVRDDWTTILHTELAVFHTLGRGIVWGVLIRAWEELVFRKGRGHHSRVWQMLQRS